MYEVNSLPASLARIIVYSMSPDSIPTPGSNVPTPALTPFQSGMNTPMPQDTRKGTIGDYLSAPLGKGGHGKAKTYLAGSRALDGLAKLIATVESFFHPSNSGSWTADVSFFSLDSIRTLIHPWQVECIHQVHCIRLQQAYVPEHPRKFHRLHPFLL